MPAVNSEAMSEHLKEVSTQVAASAHAILLCDGAGWHQHGDRLVVPDNVTLLPIPPYTGEPASGLQKEVALMEVDVVGPSNGRRILERGE